MPHCNNRIINKASRVKDGHECHLSECKLYWSEECPVLREVSEGPTTAS
jgi:hypothetical protein